MEPGLVIGLSIGIILIFGLLMERARLPMVLGVLLAGALLGPASPLAGLVIGPLQFDALVINQPEMVNFFALLGSVLILFGIGLEFSIIKLTQLGLSTFLAALIKVGLTYIVGYSISILMGFPTASAVLLGLLLSFSSTPIVAKILEGHGKGRRPETPFILAVLIIEDLVAVGLLGIIATGTVSDQYGLISAVLKIIATFVLAYIGLTHVIKKMLALVEHSDELMVLFVVSIVLVISYLCQAIGLGFSVGSFLAGSVVATTPQARRIGEMLRPFNALFASFFFFSIGMLVDARATLTALPLLLGLLLVASIGKFGASAVGGYLSGLTGSSASFAASALLPLGELSLLIGSGAAAAGLLPTGLIGLLATIIVITSLISVFMVGAERPVYNGVRSVMPEVLTRNMRMMRSTSVGMQRVVEENSRYQRIVDKLPSISQGRGWGSSTHEQLGLSLKNTLIFGLGTGVLFLLLRLAQGPMQAAFSSIWIFIFLGFYIVGTLFILNVSGTLRTYIQILTHAGKEGLAMVMHIGASAAFFGLGALVFLLWIWTADWHSLIFLVPILVLGLRHPLALMQRLRLMVFRYR